jgi:hypothetical protein
MLGTLSDESTDLSFVRVTASKNKSIVNMYIIFTVYMLFHSNRQAGSIGLYI